MKLVVLDFETANQFPASACSVGFLVVEDGVVLHEAVYLIKPHPRYASFDRMNISIHGIHPEQVLDEPTFDIIYEKLRPWFEDAILMAHNALFDMTVLRALIEVYGLDKPSIQFIDSLEVSRKTLPFLPNHRLNTVCEYMGITLDHHEALSDARGSALIALNTMAQIGEFDLVTWIALMRLKIYTL